MADSLFFGVYISFYPPPHFSLRSVVLGELAVSMGIGQVL